MGNACCGGVDNAQGALMVGLDGAGSTTVLYFLKEGKRIQTVPTLGVNNEVLKVDGSSMEIYEIGGSDKVRALWRTYSKLAHGVIFVVDATDESRFDVAKDELRRLFFGDKHAKSLIVPDIPLLLLLNKQDLPNCVPTSQIVEHLDLDVLPVRALKVLECSAATGQNLADGFRWLAHELQKNADD